jgi:hypothetical protein
MRDILRLPPTFLCLLLAAAPVAGAAPPGSEGPSPLPSDHRALPDGPVLEVQTIPELGQTLLFVRFPSPGEGPVRIRIEDEEGGIHAELPAEPERGSALVVWDGTDVDGEPLPSGIYTARLLHAGGEVTAELVR